MTDPTFTTRWWATSFTGQMTRRWAYYTVGASMGPIDTGAWHGPELERYARLRELDERLARAAASLPQRQQ